MPLRDTRFRKLASRLKASVVGLAADPRGVAAVEFAAVLPVMLAMYLGTVEVSQGVSIDRKVTLLSRALSDLTAQAATVDNTELNNIFAAAATVLAPFPATNAQMVISSIVFDGTNPMPKAKVAWSEARGTGAVPRTRCDAELPTTVIPTGIRLKDSSVIMAEIRLPYTPQIGYVLTGTITLGETTFMRPRLQTYVKRVLSNGTTYEKC
jgi:Flp pilus assembly protein TadG